MFCRLKKKKLMILVVLGAISMLFGILLVKTIPESNHSFNMLCGMFTGLGAAFVAIGVIQLIRMRITDPKKLKEKEIEQTDERNIQILRASYTMTAVCGLILLAIMAFVFVGLGYVVPAFISIGAIYVEVLVFFISHRIFCRRM